MAGCFDSLFGGVTLGFAGGLCGDYVTTFRGLPAKFHNVDSGMMQNIKSICDWCGGSRQLQDGRLCPVCIGKGIPIPEDENTSTSKKKRFDRPTIKSTKNDKT